MTQAHPLSADRPKGGWNMKKKNNKTYVGIVIVAILALLLAITVVLFAA